MVVAINKASPHSATRGGCIAECSAYFTACMAHSNAQLAQKFTVLIWELISKVASWLPGLIRADNLTTSISFNAFRKRKSNECAVMCGR